MSAGENAPMQGLADRRGPLISIKIVELAGIGPAPLCCTLLADLAPTLFT